MKYLLLLFLIGSAGTMALSWRQSVDVEVRDMFYACEPCHDEYQVLQSYTKSGNRLVGDDVAIKYRGDYLSEINEFSAPDTQHSQFRVIGTVSWFGHTIEASSVTKRW